MRQSRFGILLPRFRRALSWVGREIRWLGQNASGQPQHVADGFCRHGAREQESLSKSATQLPQKCILLLRLDSFRHNVHAQHARQLHDGAHNLQGLFASTRHARNKRAIDLKHVERKGVQVMQ